MKYIIMAGGKYTEFEVQRPLTKINGEPLIERTIRLLKDLGVENITISTNKDNNVFDYLGLEVIKMDNSYQGYGGKYKTSSGYWCDAFYYTDEPVCYLMGDVFYSKAALKQIVDTEVSEGIRFFGTDAPYAKGYTKPWQEPLAFKVADQDLLHKACNLFRMLQDLGPGKWPFWRKPISWELAQIISGAPLNKLIIKTPIFVGVHEFAVDIDAPQDIHEIELAVKEFNIE